LVNAVTGFSRDIYTTSQLTRLLPVETVIANQSNREKTVQIKQVLPPGVEGFEYKPAPPVGEEIKWEMTIPGNSASSISYWLKLPDHAKTFDVKIELYEEGTLKYTEFFTVNVIREVFSYLNEMLVELETLEVSGKDYQFLSKAKNHLEQIRNRTGETVPDHLANLLDAVWVSYYLGEIKETDVSVPRSGAQELMVVMGRWYYEAVKQ